jgi:pimeloyl-ACP methyl ester carboxylesterase
MNSTLVEITTKDNLIHQGIFAEPEKKSGPAFLFVHGLSSNFYSNTVRTNMMIEMCGAKGIGFASFNTRGHDTVTGIKKIDTKKESGQTRVTGGAGIERFEECVYDIDAGITFLKQKGFTKIILVGSSTGANKVCFYAGTQNDPRVTGVILVSAVCDHLIPSKDISRFGLIFARILRVLGRGNTFIPFAGSYPVTPNRVLSLMTPHSVEDVFDYDDSEHGLKIFGNVTKPLLIVLGEQDEYMDRPAFVIKAVYDKKSRAKNYAAVIIKGADHGFKGKEKEFGETVIRWVQSLR